MRTDRKNETFRLIIMGIRSVLLSFGLTINIFATEPKVSLKLEPLTLAVGEINRSIDLDARPYFIDPEGDSLYFTFYITSKQNQFIDVSIEPGTNILEIEVLKIPTDTLQTSSQELLDDMSERAQVSVFGTLKMIIYCDDDPDLLDAEVFQTLTVNIISKEKELPIAQIKPALKVEETKTPAQRRTEIPSEPIIAQSRPSNLISYSTFGAGVLTVGLGFLFHNQANSRYEEYEAATTTEDADRLYDETIKLDKRSKISFGVGGGLVAFGAVYYILNRVRTPSVDYSSVSVETIQRRGFIGIGAKISLFKSDTISGIHRK